MLAAMTATTAKTSPRSRLSRSLARLALLALLLPGCPSASPEPEPEPEPETPTPDPGPYPDHCGGVTFDGQLSEIRVGDLTGEDLVPYPYPLWPAGTLFTNKVIPQQPVEVTGVRASFTGPPGPVRLRLTHNFGRTYPDLETDLFEPIEAELTEDQIGSWFVSFPIPPQTVFLEPTEHYILLAEQQEGGPILRLESLPEGEYSRAMIHVPDEVGAYGSEGNFRIELEGNSFCELGGADRFFDEVTDAPWAEVRSPRAAFTDLDGDGHDDLVLVDGGPTVWFGDGEGGFAEADFDPFVDVPGSNMAVFADIDNDGDVDAFASVYVGADDDNDGVAKFEGDCNDTSADVSPNRVEVDGNGIDDDCDGVADDGTSQADEDGDGASIADGDCDDMSPEVHPGAEELRDGLDNDCDGATDETFVNRVLLNDGTGDLIAVDAGGVESVDPSTAAAFADADGDGILDLYWGNWLRHYPDDRAVQDVFVRGLGEGRFEDALASSGMELFSPKSVYGVLWNDWNDDGAQDLLVSNYHLYANQLWENDGTGHFENAAEEVGAGHDDIEAPYPQSLTYTGGHSYGGDFGDVDNDGDWDMYMCNLAHPRVQPWSDPSMFLINQGAPGYEFANLPAEYGFIYDEGDVNASFADFDNDMDVDLAIASLYTGHYSRLYRNDGEAGFVDVSWRSGVAVHDSVTAVWSDVDEDGDLDLVIADRSSAPNVHLFINRVGQDRNWIELVLEGTTTNRDAIGARVRLTAGGVTQMREVRGGGGHNNAQNSRVVHFGLADEESLDEVTIRWVGGDEEAITGLAPNGRYRVVEGTGAGELIGG